MKLDSCGDLVLSSSLNPSKLESATVRQKSIEPVRVESSIRLPCFHCSKSLRFIPKLRKYVGFSLSTDPDKLFHKLCLQFYLSDTCAECYSNPCNCEEI